MAVESDLQNPIVETRHGPVRGNERVSFLGDRFFSFRSIPYAKPPLGVLRFKDPQPPDTWVEPLDATKPPVHAPFLDDTEKEVFTTSEDCLVLNVYTKELRPKTPSPVMVWIHGGAFRVGSSSEHMYGPDFLLQKDVVVVTINYRLGALGFLSIDDPSLDVPGNAGLKDQSLALRWVRTNIAAFGGDAKNVTVFGNSAGAGSIHLHMLSNHSRDLFDKAIVQSGSALADWANFPKNDWTKRLAVSMGWKGEGDHDMFEFLQDADVNKIIEHQDTILTKEEQMYGIFSFGPAKEAYASEHTFFTKDPKDLVGDAWSSSVPMIIGATADEMLMMNKSFKKAPSFFQSLDGFELIIPPLFGHVRGSAASLDIAREIQHNYYGDNEVTETNYTPTMQAWADRHFWYPLKMSVEARLVNENQTADTYVFRFDVDSKIFNWKKMQFAGEDVPGACHAQEVHFLFKCAYLENRLPENSLEMITVRKMVGAWTAFAATGNPNCAEIGPLIWEPITDLSKAMPCLNIGDTLMAIDLPETSRVDFWSKLYEDNAKSDSIST